MFFSKSSVLVCSVNFHLTFYLLVTKLQQIFKDEIIHLLKEKGRLKFPQDVALDVWIEKEKHDAFLIQSI